MTKTRISPKEIEFLIIIMLVTFIVTFGGNYIDEMEMQKNLIKSFFTGVTAALFGFAYYIFRNIK